MQEGDCKTGMSAAELERAKKMGKSVESVAFFGNKMNEHRKELESEDPRFVIQSQVDDNKRYLGMALDNYIEDVIDTEGGEER